MGPAFDSVCQICVGRGGGRGGGGRDVNAFIMYVYMCMCHAVPLLHVVFDVVVFCFHSCIVFLNQIQRLYAFQKLSH